MSRFSLVGRAKDKEWVKYLFGPIKMEYRSDTKVKVIGPDNSLVVKNIGTIKPEHWHFENEYRFLVLANHDWNSSSKSFEFKEGPYYSDVVAELIDIEINQVIFDSMEVLLGPNCQESEYIIVDSLVNRYTANGIVLESKLKNKIKF